MAGTLGLIAGGTGITPMLQLVELVLANPADITKVPPSFPHDFLSTSPAAFSQRQRLSQGSGSCADRLCSFTATLRRRTSCSAQS